ncbi:hypothetical protein DTO027B9_6931 [Paecilomyces variotii]|nr:hypothetical protein DTO027B9_6931 [Paecilomyces variotii]
MCELVIIKVIRANYPRQEDIFEHIRASEEEMEINTRSAQHVPGSIEPVDVQNLLAAIAKLEGRNKLQIAAERTIKAYPELSNPLYSPTSYPWRVARVLDSLSSLLVSKPSREVIATALRVDKTEETIEFFLAANDDVSSKTSSHLEWIWETMRQISSRYREAYYNPTQNSPTHNIKDENLLRQFNSFSRRCVEFTASKIRKRVNGGFGHFQKINRSDFGENHPFRRIIHTIVALETITREGAPHWEQKPMDDATWEMLLHLLRTCQRSINDFLKNGAFTPDELLRVNHFPKWESYLRKIAGVMNNVDILIRAALSPRCEHLFGLTFKLYALPAISSRSIHIPQTPKEWETVLEKALSARNRNDAGGLESQPKVMNMSVINNDTAYMAQQVLNQDLVVHCETKILLHIAKTERENPRLAKAYSYVGVSKLSCQGCHCFFLTYNRIHDTRYYTRGTHGKSYWPWQFPQNFSRSQETAACMYQLLARRWVDSYDGYVAEKVHFGPDSTAASQTSQTVTWEKDKRIHDKVEELIRKVNNLE